jgi:hypothetical protein
MTIIVTKEADGIVKNTQNTTNYFLVPRDEDALLTVQIENGHWGISDELAGLFINCDSREQAERKAEQLIIQYRLEWMEIRQDTLPDDIDDTEWDCYEVDCMWIEKAAKAAEARLNSFTVEP